MTTLGSVNECLSTTQTTNRWCQIDQDVLQFELHYSTAQHFESDELGGWGGVANRHDYISHDPLPPCYHSNIRNPDVPTLGVHYPEYISIKTPATQRHSHNKRKQMDCNGNYSDTQWLMKNTEPGDPEHYTVTHVCFSVLFMRYEPISLKQFFLHTQTHTHITVCAD